MSQTPDTPQPRIPGVRYKTVTRHRAVTTVIDGIPSTDSVPYQVEEPVPPIDWDSIVLRGVIGVAVGATVVAFIGTTGSVGGLLTTLVHPVIAYGMGTVFTASWLACLGVEWLEKVNPERAKPARRAGRAALAIGMAAVIIYGHSLGMFSAGVIGACIDLLAKGMWSLVMRMHAVPLDRGVAHWVDEQEQKLAGRAFLAARLTRLNRRAAYQRAVGGREFDAASAILTSVEPAGALPTVEPTVTGSREPAPAAGEPAAAAPTIPVSGQVPPTSGQQSAQVTPPAVPAPGQAPAMPGPQVPSMSGQPDTPSGPQAATAPVVQIGASIAATIRNALDVNPHISDEALTDLVRDAHGNRKDLADTVRRSRAREEAKRRENTG